MPPRRAAATKAAAASAPADLPAPAQAPVQPMPDIQGMLAEAVKSALAEQAKLDAARMKEMEEVSKRELEEKKKELERARVANEEFVKNQARLMEEERKKMLEDMQKMVNMLRSEAKVRTPAASADAGATPPAPAAASAAAGKKRVLSKKRVEDDEDEDLSDEDSASAAATPSSAHGKAKVKRARVLLRECRGPDVRWTPLAIKVLLGIMDLTKAFRFKDSNQVEHEVVFCLAFKTLFKSTSNRPPATNYIVFNNEEGLSPAISTGSSVPDDMVRRAFCAGNRCVSLVLEYLACNYCWGSDPKHDRRLRQMTAANAARDDFEGDEFQASAFERATKMRSMSMDTQTTRGQVDPILSGAYNVEKVINELLLRKLSTESVALLQTCMRVFSCDDIDIFREGEVMPTFFDPSRCTDLFGGNRFDLPNSVLFSVHTNAKGDRYLLPIDKKDNAFDVFCNSIFKSCAKVSGAYAAHFQQSAYSKWGAKPILDLNLFRCDGLGDAFYLGYDMHILSGLVPAWILSVLCVVNYLRSAETPKNLSPSVIDPWQFAYHLTANNLFVPALNQQTDGVTLYDSNGEPFVNRARRSKTDLSGGINFGLRASSLWSLVPPIKDASKKHTSLKPPVNDEGKPVDSNGKAITQIVIDDNSQADDVVDDDNMDASTSHPADVPADEEESASGDDHVEEADDGSDEE